MIIQTIIYMSKLNLKRARTVLPYGAINEISEKTGIYKGDVSRILKGLECKSSAKVEDAVVEYLRETKIEIESILSNSSSK